MSAVCFQLEVSARSWSLVLRSPIERGARLLGLQVRIQPRAWMFVCCRCCVFSGRGLCEELITRSEESYRTWCSLARIAGSNPTEGMDVCLLWVLCVFRYRSLRGADHSFWGVLSNVVLTCWDCRFESNRGHGCLSVVSAVCFQVEVSARSWSLVLRSPIERGASLCDCEAWIMKRLWSTSGYSVMGGDNVPGFCWAKALRMAITGVVWGTDRLFDALQFI